MSRVFLQVVFCSHSVYKTFCALLFGHTGIKIPKPWAKSSMLWDWETCVLAEIFSIGSSHQGLKAFISVCTHSFGWLTWRMRPAVVTDSICVYSFEAKLGFWLQSPIFMMSQHQCRICNCCHSDWRFYVFCAHERPQCSQAQDAWHKLPCIWRNSLQDELEFEWDLCCSEFKYSLQNIVPAWWWKKRSSRARESIITEFDNLAKPIVCQVSSQFTIQEPASQTVGFVYKV